MSALGHEQIFCLAKRYIRPTPQKAGIGWRRWDVVFRSLSDFRPIKLMSAVTLRATPALALIAVGTFAIRCANLALRHRPQGS